jgi:hypothetical protein
MHYGKSENNNNKSFLTIHVLDNLKIAALCNADMTAMTGQLVLLVEDTGVPEENH